MLVGIAATIEEKSCRAENSLDMEYTWFPQNLENYKANLGNE